MVRPHPDWSDSEAGYELDGTSVVVEPADIEHSDSGELRRVGIEPAAAKSFAVSVGYGGATVVTSIS